RLHSSIEGSHGESKRRPNQLSVKRSVRRDTGSCDACLLRACPEFINARPPTAAVGLARYLEVIHEILRRMKPITRFARQSPRKAEFWLGTQRTTLMPQRVVHGDPDGRRILSSASAVK